MKNSWKLALALPLLLLSACNNTGGTNAGSGNPTQDKGVPSAGQKIKIGYVLHGLNDFTQVIKRGAEDAGHDLGVEVEVTGPEKFEANEAIGMFEGMVQKRKDGLVVVPVPGDVWKRPIKEATDAGIPVATANSISEGSTASVWFGQDEYQSGVILAEQMRKQLAAQGKKSGTILVGICVPAMSVLQDRYRGFKKGMEGSGFTITDAKDVTASNTTNYSSWENLVPATPNIVAAVGLCSMDIPNLYKLKQHEKATWLIGGYDLNKETLDAVKAGICQVTLGQHPYLQGYLPVLALVQHLRDKKPMPQGWVDVTTEIVTKDNVDSVIPRETDRVAEKKWYGEFIAQKFGDLNAVAKPLPHHYDK
jgi:ABC-type sugar transport system substrate-binding protein